MTCASAAMEEYPSTNDVAGAELVCYFAGCGKEQFGSFNALRQHLARAHFVAKGWLVGHWAHTKYMKERAANALGPGEARFVGLALLDDGAVGEAKYHCMPCGRDCSKVSATKHMGRARPGAVPKGDLAKCCVRKDGRLITNTRSEGYTEARLRLAWALLAKETGPATRAALAGTRPSTTGA